MSDWEQDVVEMLAGCNIDGKGDPIEENEVIYALGKNINEQVLDTLKSTYSVWAGSLSKIHEICNLFNT